MSSVSDQSSKWNSKLFEDILIFFVQGAVECIDLYFYGKLTQYIFRKDRDEPFWKLRLRAFFCFPLLFWYILS